jgi:hypothetical protein
VKARAATKAAKLLTHSHPYAASAGPLAAAAAVGHAKALKEKPGKTLGATARALPGFVTAPIGAAANVGLSGYREARNLEAAARGKKKPYSSSEVTKPTTETAESLAESTKQFVKTMASGDPERIKKAVENEYGLTAPLVVGVPGARVLRGPYKRVRLKARRTAEARRAKVGKQRRPPSREAQPISRMAERRQARKRTAKRAAAARSKGQITGYRAARPVVKEARKVEGARKTIRRRHEKVDPGDVIGVVAREGINLERPEAAVGQLRRVRQKIGERPEVTSERPTTHDVLDFLESNPKVLRDKHLKRAVEHYKAQAKAVTTSERARLLPVATTHGVKLPEERVPMGARGKTKATSAAELEAEVRPRRVVIRAGKRKEYRAQGTEVTRLTRERQRARKAEGQVRILRAETRQRARTEPERAVTKRREEQLAAAQAEATQARASAKALERGIKEKRASLKEPIGPRHAEYVREVRDVMKREGLAEPAWTHAADIRRTEPVGITQPGYVQATKKVHPTTGYLQSRGLIDESLQALVGGSIAAPRMRNAIHENTARFVDEGRVAVKVGDKQKTLVTRDEAAEAARQKQFDPRHVALFPLQQFKQAVDDVRPERFDEAMGTLEASLESSKGLREEIAGRVEEAGSKYVLVDREAAKEFIAQMQPVGEAMKAATASSRVASRLILGTSPAWVIAQFVAEGGQAAVAPPRPVLIARAIAAERRLSPEERAGWAAIAGETPGVAVSPRDLQLSLRPETNAQMVNAFKAMERSVPGRLVKRTATLDWLGIIDRWKGAGIRRAVMGAHLQREFSGFAAGVKGLWGEQERLAKQLAGKPLEEQMRYVVSHPKAAERMQSYLDDVMGNWTALTRYERVAAPLAIFYPFIRMSLRWLLWSFPARHPLKWSTMYWLGQWNAEELKKMLGGDPGFFSQWADAPLRGGKKGEATSTLPLARVTPGSNALIEAAGEGFGAQTTKAFTPGLAASIALLTGVDPLSGKRIEGQGGQQASFTARAGLAVAQLAAAPTPVRIADQLRGSRERESLPVIGPRRPDSALGKLIEMLSPKPGEKAVRSGVLPFLPNPAGKQAELAKVFRILDAIRVNKVEDADVAAAASNPVKLKALAAQQDRYRKARSDLDAMFAKHHIGTKAEKKRVKEAFKQVKPFGGGKAKKKKTTTESDPWSGSSTPAPSGAGANPWK